MKQINTYINEKLRLTTKRQYTCQPKNIRELHRIMVQRIKDEGLNCDLNDIDTSKITDMRYLFNKKVFDGFNGDISMWNVSNVKTMDGLFYGCKQFNCDISMWNVSNVEHMNYMFLGCEKFNQDLSQWNVSNVEYMNGIFANCNEFNQNLNSWDVSHVENMYNAFKNCPTKPVWYDKDKWKQ